MATKSKRTRASEAKTQKRYCAIRTGARRALGPNVGGERMRLIRMSEDKWVNGTVLRYAFFANTGPFKRWYGGSGLEAQVRKAFQQWSAIGIGLSFEETKDRARAQIRIGFEAGDGHWSYVGRQVLQQGADDRTMNLDPTDAIAGGQYGVDVACHEIGHTLGFPHEHQNPNAGIVWDEEAVYAALGRPPNSWDRETTFHNIIRKIPPDQVQGSSWDPNSIMHYPFEAGLIREPARYRDGLQPAGGISERDAKWVKTFYPARKRRDEQELPLLETARLSIGPGEQRNFVLEPKVTRYYQIRTFGLSDTVGVLNLREEDGDERYLTGDDDSGEDRNMSIIRRLQAGYEYILRLRLYYAADAGETAVMWW